jgi:hypothetical protein
MKSSIRITLVTEARFVAPIDPDWFHKQVIYEDELLTKALERHGFEANRVGWDDPDYDWSSSNFIIFRAIWDYFHRYLEFEPWLNKVQTITSVINPPEIIEWNIDKHYLLDLEQLGLNIPPTMYIKAGDTRSLEAVCSESGWDHFVLKPAISGGGRHTYRFTPDGISKHEDTYQELVSKESMILQDFQHNVPIKGEISFMVFGGKFSHAILKKAKAGDFRVQDDFGGSVLSYSPSEEEISYAENVVAVSPFAPIYARVDASWDNNNILALAELELIEPELWFREDEHAAGRLAASLSEYITNQLA